MDIIKVVTAGSVDDGKSTLIGRLLYETNSLKDDQVEHIKNKSLSNGYDYLDFSLATDGLLTEREQGITIDVSNIFFSTKLRRFIVADSPGHVEYTRNMITGASNASAAIVLLDARKGVIEQTKRHFYITQLLGINNIIFAVNKMDLINYNKSKFDSIIFELKKLTDNKGNDSFSTSFIPISALKGSNITNASENIPWYKGPSFLSLLENLSVENETQNDENAFQVQLVIRPKTEKYHDYRGFAGKVKSGKFSVGDNIKIHPSNRFSRIKKIEKYGSSQKKLDNNENGVIILEDELDVSRGYTIVSETFLIKNSKHLIANVCWLQENPLKTNGIYWLQQGARKVKVKINSVNNVLNLHKYTIGKASELKLNDIGEVSIMCSDSIITRSFKLNKALGSFILIDQNTNNTAGVGLVI